MQTSAKSRLAANVEIDPEALRAVYAVASPEKRDEIEEALEQIDPRYRRGGDLYQHFPRYETDEEELEARESRVDRVRWTVHEADENGIVREYVDAQAERMLQPDATIPHGHGGGGGRSGEARKVVRSWRVVIHDEEKHQHPVTRVFIRGITRGTAWFFRSRSGDAKAWLEILADLIQADKIPPVMPRQKVKARLGDMTVWGVAEPKAEILRLRPRLKTQWLNLIAVERGGEHVRMLNAIDSDAPLENAEPVCDDNGDAEALAIRI